MGSTKRTYVICLDSLMVPGTLGEFSRAQASRRLATLLSIDISENRQGGTGKASKVFNCFGEPFCLKSIARLSRAGKSERDVQRAFQARAVAFKDEYRCQSMLRGIPFIPQVQGYGTFAGGPVMLMEWIQGTPVRTALKNRKPDALTCAQIGSQVCIALMAARERDGEFVHRDLSGHNILVRTKQASLADQIRRRWFDICLIDFGSSLTSEVVEYDPSQQTPPVWRNATPEYASPEMLTYTEPSLVGLRRSHKIDVYALCSVLWELYWGHTPYMLTETSPANSWQHKFSNLPLELHDRPQEDELFIQILLGGLRAGQMERLSLADLWQALSSFCGMRDQSVGIRLQRELELALGAAASGAPRGATIVRG